MCLRVSLGCWHLRHLPSPIRLAMILSPVGNKPSIALIANILFFFPPLLCHMFTTNFRSLSSYGTWFLALGHSVKSKILDCAITVRCMVLWKIWLHRNERIFQGTPTTPNVNEVILECTYVSSLASPNKTQHD